MGLFTNVGGELKELNLLTTNVGGELKEINSLTANIGGQPKEIFTMLPKNIYGTWRKTSGVSSWDNIKKLDENIIVTNLKFPTGSNFKVKVTINITDGYLYKSISSTKEQYHMAYLQICRKNFQMIDCGEDTISTGTQTSYTSERIYGVSSFNFSGWNVYAGRWAGSALKSGEGDISYYNNDLLSFDYSIEFELV